MFSSHASLLSSFSPAPTKPHGWKCQCCARVPARHSLNPRLHSLQNRHLHFICMAENTLLTISATNSHGLAAGCFKHVVRNLLSFGVYIFKVQLHSTNCPKLLRYYESPRTIWGEPAANQQHAMVRKHHQGKKAWMFWKNYTSIDQTAFSFQMVGF